MRFKFMHSILHVIFTCNIECAELSCIQMPRLIPKDTTMKTDALLAQELIQVIQDRKALDKRETDLKDFFKMQMNKISTDTLSVGGVLVSLVLRQGTSLNSKALTIALGEDKVGEFIKTTEYARVDVKKEDTAFVKLAA